MRDKEAEIMMEGMYKEVDDHGRPERMHGKQNFMHGQPKNRPDKHEYSGANWMVQWTKNIKAKLAKAQEIGDSKEANKLQRFLDAHGVDEAYDSWIDDPVGDDNPHLKPDKSEPDNDIDHHNQYMMDQDLLQPLHKAAQKAGAKDINDWMIKQIKEQGEEWVNWFTHEVIGQDSA